MNRGKGLIIPIIVIIAGILIIADHTYFLKSKPESGSNNKIEKSFGAGNQAGKAAVNSPLPQLNSPSVKPGADAPGNKASEGNPAGKEPVVDDPAAQKPENVSNTQPPRNGNENAVQTNNGEKAGNAPAHAIAEPPQNNANTQSNSPEQAAVAIPKAVEEKASAIAQGEVQSGDFIKVASVLLGKLSLSEIKYLFDSASNDYWVVTPVEEIEKARSILFSKLSEDDLNQLYQLGKKYGRSMAIIDPGIDVADTKAKQIKYYEEKKKQAQQ